MNSSSLRYILFLLLFLGIDQCMVAQSGAYNTRSKKISIPAGGSLSGKVTEKEKSSPLSGASVYIPDLKLGVVADASGNYQFNNLPSGSYLVEVHYVGFKTLIKTVTIGGPVTQDFVLSDAFIEESPVVVTGLSQATQIKRSHIPIISVDHRYITTNISTNIIDAIARVPGVSAVTTGPNVSKPFIRGLGFNRILTLYDGVRQEGQQWGDEHGIEVDQNTVDKVEVVKGPASLIYGSDAEASVVNLLPATPPANGQTIGNISGEYQTNNGLIAGSAMIAGNKNSVTWMGRASFKTAKNYQNSIDGRVYNTGFREIDFSGSAGINSYSGYSHLGISTFNDLQDNPDGYRDSCTRRCTKQISVEG